MAGFFQQPASEAPPLTAESARAPSTACHTISVSVRRGQVASRFARTHSTSIADILDRRSGLDIQSLDRIYLNAYVNNLQVSGQVVTFMSAHLGMPIASPAILEKIGIRFRHGM